MSESTASARRLPRLAAIGAAALLALALIAALLTFVLRSNDNTVTIDFDRTVSLYEGSKVRILGVDVGIVDKLVPRGQTVRATIRWNADYDVPADARAVIVSPSVVGDRFVQLTPAYSGGPTLDDGAHLDQSRTGTPTELDETFAALDRVATLLGPEGLNEDGSISALLENSAKNLDGKGAEIRQSLAALARLSATADATKDDFFASVEKIGEFVAALEANDASVRKFNSSLADVSGVLAAEGDDLQAAVRTLAAALQQVQGYIAENRGVLRTSLSGLADVTDNLAKQRASLDQVLTLGPKALANLALTYNPANGAIDSRASILGTKGDAGFSTLTSGAYVRAYCSSAATQNPKYRDACMAAGDIVVFLSDNAAAGGARAASTPGAASAPAPGASARDTLAYALGVSA